MNPNDILAGKPAPTGSLYPQPKDANIGSFAVQSENKAPEATMNLGSDDSLKPTPVVKVMSTRGVEYFIMFLAMGLVALSLGSVLHNMVEKHFSATGNLYLSFLFSYATASLAVSFPIFAALFLRLKRAEKTEPKLTQDPSRNRCVQLTLIITFVIGIQKLISYAHSLLNSGSNTVVSYYSVNNGGGSALGNFLDLMITVVIAGGIFLYYWLEGHTKKSL